MADEQDKKRRKSSHGSHGKVTVDTKKEALTLVKVMLNNPGFLKEIFACVMEGDTNFTLETLTRLFTEGTECCADFRKEVVNKIIETVYDFLKSIEIDDWDTETLKKRVRVINTFFRITIITDRVKDTIPSLNGLDGGDLERKTFPGLLFCMSPFGYRAVDFIDKLPLTDPLSTEWNNSREQLQQYLVEFCTSMRSIFSIFLNSPDGPTRSAFLSWIAMVVNKNSIRSKEHFEQMHLLPPMEGILEVQDAITTESVTRRVHFAVVDFYQNEQGRELLSKIPSPSMVTSMTRIIVEMVISILRTNNAPEQFDLINALLMPNMLDLRSEICWNINNNELEKIKKETRATFGKRPKEYRDNATRGLLLLYMIKYIEVGYLPELKLLKQIRVAVRENPGDRTLLRELFFREACILDNIFVNELLELALFCVKLFAYDAKNRPGEAMVYPESFLTTILTFLTEISDVLPNHHFFVHHKEEIVDLCSNLLELLIAEKAVGNVRLRSGITRLLHHWIQTTSPMWLPDKSHIYDNIKLGNSLFLNLFKFSLQFSNAVTPSESNPSMENIQIRSLMTFLWDRSAFQEWRNDNPEWRGYFMQLIEPWCNEITSYTGAAFECIKSIKKHEKNTAILSNIQLAQAKTRAKIFLIDFRNLILLLTATSKNSDYELFRSSMGEIVQLISNPLENLVGIRCEELVVQCSREIHFVPKTLVSLICQLFINLDSPPFCATMAERELSNNLKRMNNILQLYCSCPPDIHAKFTTFLGNVNKYIEKFKTEQLPEEFCDAMTCTVMKDPVMLPSSRMVVDRQTIERILKTKSEDPFDRTPLKLEDLIPQHELKERLDVFWSSVFQ